MSQTKISNHFDVTTDLIPASEQEAKPEKNSQISQTKSSKYLLIFPIEHWIDSGNIKTSRARMRHCYLMLQIQKQIEVHERKKKMKRLTMQHYKY